MTEKLEAIGYPLPEELEKRKWFGDFDGCLAIIGDYLEKDIPEALKDKLRMERVQIQRMRRDYIVTPEEAEERCRKELQNWQNGELEQLRRENAVDWAYVNGQVRYIDTFFGSLLKLRPDYRARKIMQDTPEPGKRTDLELLQEIISGMKAHGGVTARLKMQASVQVWPKEGQSSEKIHIWLPCPLEKIQMRNLHIEASTPAYFSLAPSDAPQRTAYYVLEGRTQATLTYTVENHMKYVALDPEAVSPEQPTFETGEQLPHMAFTPYLRALTREIVGEEQNPLKKARKIYDFLTQKVGYSYMRGYVSLPVIPEYCASHLRGDCGVQALTFITLCRIAGIPAKWQSGLYANENEAGCHDWAMFYIAPYGWLYADCSFGGSAWRAGDLERWNFYFGNMDPYRIVLASEFQADFQPKGRFLRSDPYDNQKGEAELEHFSLEPGQWKATAETLSAELIWDENA